jgi:hypothetical protein
MLPIYEPGVEKSLGAARKEWGAEKWGQTAFFAWNRRRDLTRYRPKKVVFHERADTCQAKSVEFPSEPPVAIFTVPNGAQQARVRHGAKRTLAGEHRSATRQLRRAA